MHADAAKLCVIRQRCRIMKYEITEDGWYITETHLAVEEYLDDIPQTKKHNVKVGHFEYKGEHDYVTEYTYEIELEWDFDTDLFIAAHAVVEQLDGGEETAWGKGDTFNNKNWAMYFVYTVDGSRE